MAYWLVNSGTREQPWSGDLRQHYDRWADDHGDVQMFPWRPARLAPGDVLIHRAVGSSGNRLIAVGEVLSRPERSGHPRWPWQIERRLSHVCGQLETAPTIADIGETPSGLRVMKQIDDEAGALAVGLIAAASAG
jgi:hypothetical protein